MHFPLPGQEIERKGLHQRVQQVFQKTCVPYELPKKVSNRPTITIRHALDLACLLTNSNGHYNSNIADYVAIKVISVFQIAYTPRTP